MSMNVQTIDFTEPGAGRELARSLHETGFAVLKNHPVQRTLLDRLYQDWGAFFNSERKFEFLFDPDNYDGTQQGFHPQHVSETAVGHTTKDLKEFYHLIPDGNNPPELAPDILAYRETTFALGRKLLHWLQENAPAEVTALFPQPLPDTLCNKASLLRILHYPPLTGDEAEAAVRAAAHEDINMITILPVAKQPGLQVRDNDGRWIDVASLPGELVINSGDMLRELTDGYYPSTSHRVLNPGGNIANESRISIPFFLTPRLEVRLSDRYTAGSYLDERLKLITRNSKGLQVQP
jgi:isopenicillin N synthase-like dioxygenase